MAFHSKEDNKKHWTDIFEAVSKSISMILIPIVAAFIGHYYTSNDNEARLRSEYIKIAVGILQDTPDANNKNIRKWAISLINHYSDVKIDEKVETQLTNEQLSKFIELTMHAVSNISPKNIEYEFSWVGDASKGYSFELQKYTSGKWVFENGLSVLGNHITLPIPVGEKMRWRIAERESHLDSAQWNELFIKSVF